MAINEIIGVGFCFLTLLGLVSFLNFAFWSSNN